MEKAFRKIVLFLTVAMALTFFIPSLGACGEKKCSFCKNGELLNSDYYYQREISTTATCTKSGIKTIQCKSCNRTAEIESPALGHDFKITKDEATCLQNGNTYYACSRKGCDITKIEFSQASTSKHKWVKTNSKETIKYTYTDYQCSVCKKTKTEKNTINMGNKVKNTEEEFYYATAAAIRIVKTKLKYPSSAKFIKERLMEVHYNYSSYFIEGAVSAPNSFGVYTDFYFIVKTKIKVTGSKFTWYDYDCVLEEG